MRDEVVEAGVEEAGGTECEPAEEPATELELPRLDEAEDAADPELPAALERFDSRLEESQRLLAHQTDLVDRLHTENQELRAGELRNAQLPLVRDLLRLHDDVGRMREAAGEAGDDLRLVQESLIDTLARNGIEPISPPGGEPVDPQRHTVAGTDPTADPALDKTVAEVTRQGFRWDSGDVIRVSEVRAYRYSGSG